MSPSGVRRESFSNRARDSVRAVYRRHQLVRRVGGQENDVAGHQALRRAAGHAQPAAAGHHRVKDGTGHWVDGHAPRLVGDELGHHGARDAAEVEHVGERVHERRSSIAIRLIDQTVMS